MSNSTSFKAIDHSTTSSSVYYGDMKHPNIHEQNCQLYIIKSISTRSSAVSSCMYTAVRKKQDSGRSGEHGCTIKGSKSHGRLEALQGAMQSRMLL
jgi:hypothetical protein